MDIRIELLKQLIILSLLFVECQITYIQNMDPKSMEYPCGPLLIFEDEFNQRSKQIFGTLNR